MAPKKRKATSIEHHWSGSVPKPDGSPKEKNEFSEDEIELLNFISEMIVSIMLKETEE